MPSRLVVTLMLACLLPALSSGCGNAPAYTGAQRFAISGSITFQGEPVSGGTISLVPEADGLNPAGGPIDGGKFTVPEEKGPNKGRYRVAVHWYKPTGKKIKDEDTQEEIDEVKQVVPSKYNDATTLTFEVTGDPTKDVIDLKLD